MPFAPQVLGRYKFTENAKAKKAFRFDTRQIAEI